MQAQVDSIGEVKVVRLIGKIDMETQKNFRDLCFKKLHASKVVFCLADLKFVGSTGIQTFFRTLSDLNTENPNRIKIAGVKMDFLRVLRYSSPSLLDIHESIEGAIQSYFTATAVLPKILE